jgi:hypothetical protein
MMWRSIGWVIGAFTCFMISAMLHDYCDKTLAIVVVPQVFFIFAGVLMLTAALMEHHI